MNDESYVFIGKYAKQSIYKILPNNLLYYDNLLKLAPEDNGSYPFDDTDIYQHEDSQYFIQRRDILRNVNDKIYAVTSKDNSFTINNSDSLNDITKKVLNAIIGP